MSGKPEKMNVTLSADLYARVEKTVAASAGFTSVEDFVVFVLNEVLSDQPEQKSAFTEKEKQEIKRTLKAFGHFDP